MSTLKTIGFDADDTLWHNERHFSEAHGKFATLFSDRMPPAQVKNILLTLERKNVKTYGYGVKGFTLSMMECALQILGTDMAAHYTKSILDIGQELLAMPIELLDDARKTLSDLAQDYELVLITKGDLTDQKRKVEQSALGDYFNAIEILSEKTNHTYNSIFARHGGAAQAAMVGNSVKSDILPALNAGAWAVHIPYHLTWALEKASLDLSAKRLLQAKNLDHAANLLRNL